MNLVAKRSEKENETLTEVKKKKSSVKKNKNINNQNNTNGINGWIDRIAKYCISLHLQYFLLIHIFIFGRLFVHLILVKIKMVKCSTVRS